MLGVAYLIQIRANFLNYVSLSSKREVEMLSCTLSLCYRRLTFLIGLWPPPKASGSTVLYPLGFLLLSLGGGGLCSSITSTRSSSTGLLVSSIMTLSSTLLSLLGGVSLLDGERVLSLLGGERVLSLVLLTSMTSLADTVDGDGGLRGDDLRGDDLRLLFERE